MASSSSSSSPPLRRAVFTVLPPITHDSLSQSFPLKLDPEAPLLLEIRPLFKWLATKLGTFRVAMGQYCYHAANVTPLTVAVEGTPDYRVPAMLYNIDGARIQVDFDRTSGVRSTAYFEYKTQRIPLLCGQCPSSSPCFSVPGDPTPLVKTEAKTEAKSDGDRMLDAVLTEQCISNPERRPLNTIWKISEVVEAKEISSRVWLPRPGPGGGSCVIPITAPGSARPVIAAEAWEWHGDIIDQDMVCQASGAMLRIGICRVRSVNTHEPIAHCGDRVFGLRRLMLAIPY